MRAHIQNTLPQAQPDGAERMMPAVTLSPSVTMVIKWQWALLKACYEWTQRALWRIGYYLPQLYFSYFHVPRFLVLSVNLTSLIYPLVAVVFGHSKLCAAVLRSFSLGLGSTLSLVFFVRGGGGGGEGGCCVEHLARKNHQKTEK